MKHNTTSPVTHTPVTRDPDAVSPVTRVVVPFQFRFPVEQVGPDRIVVKIPTGASCPIHIDEEWAEGHRLSEAEYDAAVDAAVDAATIAVLRSIAIVRQ